VIPAGRTILFREVRAGSVSRWKCAGPGSPSRHFISNHTGSRSAGGLPSSCATTTRRAANRAWSRPRVPSRQVVRRHLPSRRRASTSVHLLRSSSAGAGMRDRSCEAHPRDPATVSCCGGQGEDGECAAQPRREVHGTQRWDRRPRAGARDRGVVAGAARHRGDASQRSGVRVRRRRIPPPSAVPECGRPSRQVIVARARGDAGSRPSSRTRRTAGCDCRNASARLQHSRGGEVVADEVAELTSCTRSPAPQACEYTSRGPSPLPFSSTTASCRGALVSMMQPADLRQFNDPAEFGSVRQPGFRRVTHQ